MSEQHPTFISRRNFLKTGSFFSIAQIVVNDPALSMLSQAIGLGNAGPADAGFTCELLRSEDLLRLKYYFFNARICFGHAHRKVKDEPMYIYIQVPPQHVGEELVTENYPAYTSKAQFNRKKSFLSSSSWLAFELVTHSVRLAPEALLDWHSHFRMLTLDSFAKPDPGNKRATDYGAAITALIKAINASYDPEKTLFYASDDPNAPKPLTALAAPYKIWMSPIAEPTATPANDDPLSRVLGEHLFTGNNGLMQYYSYPQEKSRHIQIISPWKNSLVFKNYVNNQVTPPRFKVLRAGCQDEYDKQSDLLPAPIHRDDLRGLTMRPEYDRDVLSEMFTLSALGATTNLKYHNDDPTILYSIIGWEHKMKLGRDNHVTVTFRAIDYFTGLKVKVSIIADRKFSYGVSFLPKLFYVSYNEDHKPYTDPLEISRMPFTSITPKIKGTFFTPVPVPGNAGYIVCSKNAFGGGAFDPSALIDFPYDAVDKTGKPISTDAKMILILAEDYRITQGAFYPNKQPPPYNPGGPPVSIQDIGFLNPGRRNIYAGHPSAGCSLDDGQNYQFQMVKTFNASNYNGLNNQLGAIQQHVTANFGAYLSQINDSMTFSKLDRLKINPAPDKPAPIKKDSQNTTFKTSTLLLGSEINPVLFPSDGSGSPNTDNFFQEFPILPGMVGANVIISQIDQLQGRSEYHAVKYFERYRISQMEIDDNGQNPHNPYRIFFELTQGISNFFSDNYRNAGAMVNPGIQITHVSAYDNSISYNDSVIMQPQPANLAAVDPRAATVAMSSVSASSIFRELNAQILGVSLLEILEDFLGLDNIPAFAWLNQIEQTADSIQQLATQYQQYAGTWKQDFDTLTSDVTRLQSQIDQIQNQLKTLSKDGLRTWLEGMEQQIASQYLYTLQLDATTIAPLATYVTTNLLPLYNYVQGINSSPGHPGPLNLLGTSLDGILNAAATPVPLLNNLIDTVMAVPVPDPTKFNETHFKEAAKAYFANVLMTQPNIWTTYQQLMTELAAASGQIDTTRIRYYNAFNEGIQEAANFSAGLITANLNKVKAIAAAQAAQIPVYITDGMSQAGISLSTDQINGWFTILWQLINLYDDYYKQYTSLKKEYYAQLYTVLPAAPDQAPIGQIQTRLIGRMTNYLNGLTLPPNTPKLISDGFTPLKAKLSKMITGSANTLLQEYTTQIRSNEYISAIQGARGVFTQLLQNLLDQYDQVIQQLQDAQKKIIDPKQQLDNFIQNELDKLRQQVNDKLQQLAAAAQGSAAYNNLVQEINQINTFLTAIRSLAHQNLHYTFSTRNFKQASLGGIIEFIPQDGVTELGLTIDYQVDLNLGSFNQQPGISQQSFTADTSLTRFKLGLLSLLYIDFDQVRFVASSDKKDDFTVRVSNVEFAGFVSFFQIFQQFLQSLTDDFAFDITADGVSITYGLTLPDITTGYFNLFDLGLDCMIILPFYPDKALEVHFGIGSPDKKFGLTVMGIFGGQGYFNIIADPKRGIIGMDITFEFGAIFILDITVATGSACLVAGIYIRKYDGQWDLRGYILCAGRLDVLGIFSASLSFYLGLEGDGQVIAGRCTLTASCKIGFFEISVECGMYKEIQGTKSNPPNNAPGAGQPAVAAKQVAVAASVVETNVKRLQFYPEEELYFTVPSDPKQPAAAAAFLTKDGVDHPFETQTARSGSGNLTHLTYDLSNTAPGTYAVRLAGATPQTYEVTVADEDSDAVEASHDTKGNTIKVSKKSYYSSYFKKA